MVLMEKKVIKKCVSLVVVILMFMIVAVCGYKYYIYGYPFARAVKVDKCNWEIMLVNNKSYIDKEYEPECVNLSNGEKVDKRIYPQLQRMFDEARSEGISITVRSGYRSWEEQKNLWTQELERLDEEGISLHEAIEQGVLSVQRAGTSEHQTGMAVDINSMTDMDDTALYEWLKDNAYKYEFILRYPENKTDITGIMYEPWHFRYVGETTAAIIKNEDLCLEEYIDKYE